MSAGKVILIAVAVLAVIAALLFFLLYGRHILFRYSGSKGGQKINMSSFTGFHLSNSDGSYMNAGYSYDAELEDGKVLVTVRLDGMPQEEADERKIETDISFMKKLEELSESYGIKKWNGFSRSDQNVLDGYGFGLTVIMDNGEILSAHGYMAWPDNYREYSSEVRAHFMQLYESVYPDRRKALETYFSEVLVPEHGLAARSADVEYPYLCAGEGRFTYGAPDLPLGIVAHVTGNFTEEESGYTEDTDMLVAYLRRGDTDDYGYARTQLEIELYTADRNANVTLVFRDMADEEMFFNDGLMSWLFSTYADGRRYIGYYSAKSDSVSSGSRERCLKIYGMEDGSFVKVADVSAEGPAKGEWSADDTEAIMNAAGTYGLGGTVTKWKKDPSDVLISTFDINEIVSVSTYTSADSLFSDRIAETKAGDQIGDYRVKGGITGNNR